MRTDPDFSVKVRDPCLSQDFQEPTHEKSRALGRQLAVRILPRLKDTNAPATDRAPISVRARTIGVPLDNIGFLLAPVLGLLDRGHVRWKTMRTEVALVPLER